jgi:hypothetical protein
VVALAASEPGNRTLRRLPTAYTSRLWVSGKTPMRPPWPSARERTQTLPASVRDCSKASGRADTGVFL